MLFLKDCQCGRERLLTLIRESHAGTTEPQPIRARSCHPCEIAFVVAPALGPPDCRVADFIDIQTAINALPPNGGKIFVKAGTYVISKTIRIQRSGGLLKLVADMSKGNTAVTLSPSDVAMRRG